MKPTTTLAGKTALVTGATSGIGFHTAKALAALGARVFITGRDATRGQAAEASMRAAAGNDDVHFIAADGATVGGNRRLAGEILSRTDRLHVLVNNLGGCFNDRALTADGYEASLATNFVAPFVLTEALEPLLRRSAPARIVNVASGAHEMWKGDAFADLHCETRYPGTDAYARAKLLEILWTFALARRLQGSGVVANALHPGVAWTAMTAGTEARSMPGWMRLLWPLMRLLQRLGSAERAARTPIFLASAPEAADVTGAYFEPVARQTRPSAAARDVRDQEKAWELARELAAQAPTAGHSAPADGRL